MIYWKNSSTKKKESSFAVMSPLERLSKIQDKIPPNTFIIVEGKKDKSVLEKLQFKNIVTISGKGHEKLLEILKNQKIGQVIILTDFDREGNKKHKELQRLLERNGIKTAFSIREKFKQTFNIGKIEELSFITKLIDPYTHGAKPQATNKTFNINKFFRRRNHKRRKRSNRRELFTERA